MKKNINLILASAIIITLLSACNAETKIENETIDNIFDYNLVYYGQDIEEDGETTVVKNIELRDLIFYMSSDEVIEAMAFSEDDYTLEEDYDEYQTFSQIYTSIAVDGLNDDIGVYYTFESDNLISINCVMFITLEDYDEICENLYTQMVDSLPAFLINNPSSYEPGQNYYLTNDDNVQIYVNFDTEEVKNEDGDDCYKITISFKEMFSLLSWSSNW